MALPIDGQVSPLEQLVPGMLPGQLLVPVEMGLDPGHQFSWAERLHDVVIGAQAQPPDLVHIFLPGGDL